MVLEKKHQIANFADFCNECGNCDIFCPEDGGPYVLKPRFFGSRESFREFRTMMVFSSKETMAAIPCSRASARMNTKAP
ncbi:MAG: hypothetical protein Ct9H90mP9_0360 [Pseudomonadota bacterium]|nr:MAG: hypothetical protein Ct9H90mP9_0360 [Pseudomonadota bacterium]